LIPHATAIVRNEFRMIGYGIQLFIKSSLTSAGKFRRDESWGNPGGIGTSRRQT